MNKQIVPLRATELWLHRNRPGTSELLPRPFAIKVSEGIAVYPEKAANVPRIPLLGLRSLLNNGLRVVIDGKQKTVSINS